MTDERTLRIGRRGANLLLRGLTPYLLSVGGEDRAYLVSLLNQLQDFVGTPPPRYVSLTVLSIDGVPVDEHGRKKNS